MSRTYAQFSTSIWRDADFLALPASLQRIYMLLSSQPDISAAGVLPLAVNRWAGKAPDTTPGDIVEGLRGLADQRFIVFDRDTEELFVRSFVRWDNGYKNPKRLHAIRDAADQIESVGIIAALAAEFERLEVAEAFRGQCSSRCLEPGEPPPVNNDCNEFSQVDRQSIALIENQEGESNSRRRVPQPSTLNPQPVPPPAAPADAEAAQTELPGMPSVEVEVAVETDEQRAWRLSRAWLAECPSRNIPVVKRGKGDLPMKLKTLLVGYLAAKFAEVDINEALRRCDKAIPSGDGLDAALKAIQRARDLQQQDRGAGELERRGGPTVRSPADQRVADAMPLYEKYKRQEMEEENARG
jgi:hypothetical protein